MSKLYFDNTNIGEGLNNLGLNLYKDIYIEDDELATIMNKIIDDIMDMEVVRNLSNVGIHLDISYMLDTTIYREW